MFCFVCAQVLPKQLQPVFTPDARLRKCCPLGQSYNRSGAERPECAADNVRFAPTLVDAVLYENCIEDTELPTRLDYAIGDECNNVTNPNVFYYSKKYGDLLYVLQNGSLLLVDAHPKGYNFYITNNYCLDMDRDGGAVTAIVCQRREVVVTRGEALIYASCLLISVPCLLLTAFLYCWIDDLRDLHSQSLACHSVCLAIGFVFLAGVQIHANVSIVTTYFIQYFMLACYIWLAVLCADVCTQVWYCLPRNLTQCCETQRKYFVIYLLVAFGVPLLPVVLAYCNGVAGVPMYYLKGIESTIPTTHVFFFPPIAFVLIVCTGLLGAAYYGFIVNRPVPLSKAQDENETPKSIISYERYYEALRL